MKKVALLGSLIVCSITILIGLSACGKLKEDRDNITSAEDFASSETEAASLFDVSDDMNESSMQSTIVPSGATITVIDTQNSLKVYELDFGPLGSTAPKGKLCGDGRYRAGKVRISFTVPYKAVGSVATIKTTAADDYYCGDGNSMTKLITDISIKRTATYSFEIGVNGTQLIFPDGRTASYQGVRYFSKTSGQNIPGIWGDEYEVTGSGSGVNREGDSYTWSVTSPLLKRMQLGCARTFVRGIISVQNVDASRNLEIDFDPFNNAACDRTAKALFGNRSVTFTIR
jgi:hypothetical protein